MIRCLPDEVKNLNDSIDFVFGQLKVSFPMKNFFGLDFSHFERNKNIYYNQKGIIFGNSFLLLFDYLNFNYETQQIGFYGNDINIEMIIPNSNRYNVLNFINILVITCILNIFFLGVIKKKGNIL